MVINGNKIAQGILEALKRAQEEHIDPKMVLLSRIIEKNMQLEKYIEEQHEYIKNRMKIFSDRATLDLDLEIPVEDLEYVLELLQPLDNVKLVDVAGMKFVIFTFTRLVYELKNSIIYIEYA